MRRKGEDMDDNARRASCAELLAHAEELPAVLIRRKHRPHGMRLSSRGISAPRLFHCRQLVRIGPFAPPCTAEDSAGTVPSEASSDAKAIDVRRIAFVFANARRRAKFFLRVFP